MLCLFRRSIYRNLKPIMDDVPGCSKDTPQTKRRRRDEVFRYTQPDFEHKIMQCLKELEDEEESVDQGGLIYDSDDINDPNYTDDLQQDDQNISSDDLDEDNYDSDPEPEENANGEPVYKRKESICTTEPSLPDYFVSKINFKWSSTESTTKTKIPQHI